MSAEIAVLALVLALVLLIAAIAVRRSLLTRSGGVDVCWRNRIGPDGNGWTFGQGRYRDNELTLYRSFSPLPIASRKLLRNRLTLGARRSLAGTEPDLLPVGSVVLRCTDGRTPIELALAEEAATGLRSWLESVPPATGSLHNRHRSGVHEL